MDESIRLGTIRGIRVGAHWSVVVVGLLLATGLAGRVLPGVVPGEPGARYWLAAGTVALLFLASLLAHELAHALVARREGMRVAGITLWLLGGVARIDGAAPSPGAEFRMAGVGPLVSALLAAGFGAAGAALGGAGAPGLVVEGARYLAVANGILALFNLLPGAPLDGGRLVHAVAWRLGRDRLRATLVASRLGRILGFALIGIGIAEIVGGADLGGLWTIVLGFFLQAAAASEAGGEVARAALEEVRVGETMTAEPPRAPGGLTVDLFAEGVLAAERATVALVTGPAGEVVGVAGTAEVAAVPPGDRRVRRLAEIAIPLAALPQADPGEPVLAALARAGAGPAATGPGRPGYLLVVDRGACVGLVTPADLARTLETRSLLVRGVPGSGPAPAGGPATGEGTTRG